MGQPVVHFEIMGTDQAKLQSFYSDLFGWNINADNPQGYGIVEREVNGDGIGIAGGVGAIEGVPGHVTFYIQVPDVEAALAKAEKLGGTRLVGPDQVAEGVVIGLFNDPEGHLVGVTGAALS